MHPAIILIMLFARFDFRASGTNPAVLGILSDLSERGARTIDDIEVAAFIVKTPDGQLSCVLWPHTASIRSARYDGPIPIGTIALAHTHPLYAERPSRGDVDQAQRIGLPIYVVTRWHLYVVDPTTGQSVELIRQKNWTRGNPHCDCKVLRPAEDSLAMAGGSADHR